MSRSSSSLQSSPCFTLLFSVSKHRAEAAKNTINIMNYTYFPLILWMKLRSQAASPHAIITEVTTALINTVQRQIKTHNALLHPHRDSNQLMTQWRSGSWTRWFNRVWNDTFFIYLDLWWSSPCSILMTYKHPPHYTCPFFFITPLPMWYIRPAN